MKIGEIPSKVASTSKIPVAFHEVNFIKDSDLSSVCPSESSFIKHEKKRSLKTNRHLEKHCAKLREEIMVLQVTSSQEQANLSKKIENISKEKRDLHKKLSVAQKENHAAKQQLEEVLSERSLLIKRLEVATKEVKFNTKTKKSTLAKLEEALGNMEKLKLKLDQVSRDKEILEDKLHVLEKEYNQLKDQDYIFSLNEEPVMENDLKEHAIDKQDCGDHVTYHTSSQVSRSKKF